MLLKSKQIAEFLYNHNAVRYVFVGGTTFLIDITTLLTLHGLFDMSVPVATTAGYWLSIIYNFSLNRWWTFNAQDAKKIHEHAILYAMLLGFNYCFTLGFVSIMSHYIYVGFAKVMATGIQIIWTYPTYKYLIFTKD